MFHTHFIDVSVLFCVSYSRKRTSCCNKGSEDDNILYGWNTDIILLSLLLYCNFNFAEVVHIIAIVVSFLQLT